MRLVERDRRQHNRQRPFILRLQRRHGEFGGAHAHCLFSTWRESAPPCRRQLGSGGLTAEEHALMELSKSFRWSIAHDCPFFDIRRSIRDQTRHRHLLAVRFPARSIRCAIDISRNDTRIDCMPLNGWSDTYRPAFHVQIQLGFLYPTHIGHLHHGVAHARIVKSVAATGLTRLSTCRRS